MGLPRNKQGGLAELSLRVDKRDDEHSHDMHALLEENALLRRILIKLDLVRKKVVGSTSHQFTAEPPPLTNAAQPAVIARSSSADYHRLVLGEQRCPSRH